MIKKCLHRIAVVWCLYGLVRVCILANPLLLRLANLALPQDAILANGGTEAIVATWLLALLTILALVVIVGAIHLFANWFFNTQK